MVAGNIYHVELSHGIVELSRGELAVARRPCQIGLGKMAVVNWLRRDGRGELSHSTLWVQGHIPEWYGIWPQFTQHECNVQEVCPEVLKNV